MRPKWEEEEMTYTLAITDRANSSWSLRAWLLFAKLDIPVRTTFARSHDPAFLDGLADFAPARTVPALRIDGESRRVGAGDAVLIPAGSWHQITATAELRFLCCCVPPYSDADTFFE